LRRFSGVFLGAFLEATGPGASVRGVFSAEGVPLVRWASGNFDFFRGFFTLLDRFLPVFVPFFALFSSMPCAYLYVNNFFPVSLAWELHSLHRRGAENAENGGNGGTENPETGKGTAKTAQPSPQRSQRPALSERSESKGRRGRIGGKKVQSAKCRVQNDERRTRKPEKGGERQRGGKDVAGNCLG
jgi:hypothetical protein